MNNGNDHNDSWDNAPARAALSALRHDIAKESIQAFAQIYLKDHFFESPCSMHNEILDLARETTNRHGVKLAIAAPGGYGKSTLVSFAYVLWCICYQREPFIALFSHDARQAQDHLGKIKGELQKNPLLREDFPEVCQLPAIQGSTSVWRKDEIVLRNGIRVLALGAKSPIRPGQSPENRPTLIILDDTEKDVSSEQESESILKWLIGLVVMTATEDTNFIVIGTLVKNSALLTRLGDDQVYPEWERRHYSAVVKWAKREDLWSKSERIHFGHEEYEGGSGPQKAEQFCRANEQAMLEGSEVLWSECEGYFQLMRHLLILDKEAFFIKKQNGYFPVIYDQDGEYRPPAGIMKCVYETFSPADPSDIVLHCKMRAKRADAA